MESAILSWMVSCEKGCLHFVVSIVIADVKISHSFWLLVGFPSLFIFHMQFPPFCLPIGHSQFREILSLKVRHRMRNLDIEIQEKSKGIAPCKKNKTKQKIS